MTETRACASLWLFAATSLRNFLMGASKAARVRRLTMRFRLPARRAFFAEDVIGIYLFVDATVS